MTTATYEPARLDQAVFSGSYLPGMRGNLNAEDPSLHRCGLPGAVLVGMLRRGDLSRNLMPGSLLRLVAPRLNMQRLDLSDSDITGSQLPDAFAEESRLKNLISGTAKDGTDLSGIQLAEAVITGWTRDVATLVGAFFGHGSLPDGNKRKSLRAGTRIPSKVVGATAVAKTPVTKGAPVVDREVI